MGGRLITKLKSLDYWRKREVFFPFSFVAIFKLRFVWLLLGLFLVGGFVIYFRYYTREKIVIAVVDTGLDLKQVKFKFTTVEGLNVLNPDLPPQDDNGHGTQISSVIHFLEPRVKIMPIKVIPRSGVTTRQELARGIITAVDRGAQIINISAGIISPGQDLENAVNYAEKMGVLIVAAVGDNEFGIEYPADYPNVLAVGGVDYNGARLDNSGIGSELDVMALGEYATIGLRGECLKGAGTSLAAPIVSAYLAKILFDNYNFTPQQSRDTLLSSVMDIGKPGKDDETGYGLLEQWKVVSKICE